MTTNSEILLENSVLNFFGCVQRCYRPHMFGCIFENPVFEIDGRISNELSFFEHFAFFFDALKSYNLL